MGERGINDLQRGTRAASSRGMLNLALKLVPFRPVVVAVLAGAAVTVMLLRKRRARARLVRVEPRPPTPDGDVPWGEASYP